MVSDNRTVYARLKHIKKEKQSEKDPLCLCSGIAQPEREKASGSTVSECYLAEGGPRGNAEDDDVCVGEVC